jgi:UDP:flavonoid glycosyltransferase YjiC (YdhE family)
MKITLLTAGSRGDVQPYLALASGLKKAGHQVCLASYAGFADWVTSYSVDFAAVTPLPAALTSSRKWRLWQKSGSDLIRFIRYYIEIADEARSYIETMLDDFWRASQDAELIVSSASGFVGLQIAQAKQVRHCWALFQPMTRTSAFPHFATPGGFRFGENFNSFTYQFAERIYLRLFGGAITHWLQTRVKAPIHLEQGQTMFSGSPPSPVLYGFSASVIPKPADWGENTYICGYWFLERPKPWQPSDELISFLESGVPPLYIGMENIRYPSQEALLKLILKALEISNQRALLFIGGREVDRHGLPHSVLLVNAVPHDWLFPHVSAVIHHGGAGTTGSALRAGVPSFGIPGFFDQPFWSRRIHEIGAGLPPIQPQRLTPQHLASAMHQLVNDNNLRDRSARLGEELRRENGIERAIEVIEII